MRSGHTALDFRRAHVIDFTLLSTNSIRHFKFWTDSQFRRTKCKSTRKCPHPHTRMHRCGLTLCRNLVSLSRNVLLNARFHASQAGRKSAERKGWNRKLVGGQRLQIRWHMESSALTTVAGASLTFHPFTAMLGADEMHKRRTESHRNRFLWTDKHMSRLCEYVCVSVCLMRRMPLLQN